MKAIQPVETWQSGETHTATHLDLRIIFDDLATTATLYYELKAVSEESSLTVAVGNHTIEGETYQSWGESGDINLETYTIVANKLNLILQ